MAKLVNALDFDSSIPLFKSEHRSHRVVGVKVTYVQRVREKLGQYQHARPEFLFAQQVGGKERRSTNEPFASGSLRSDPRVG